MEKQIKKIFCDLAHSTISLGDPNNKEEYETRKYYVKNIQNYLNILAVIKFRELGFEDLAFEILKEYCEDCYNNVKKYIKVIDSIVMPECCIKSYNEEKLPYDIKYYKAIGVYSKIHDIDILDTRTFISCLYSGFNYLVSIFIKNGVEWKEIEK